MICVISTFATLKIHPGRLSMHIFLRILFQFDVGSCEFCVFQGFLLVVSASLWKTLQLPSGHDGLYGGKTSRATFSKKRIVHKMPADPEVKNAREKPRRKATEQNGRDWLAKNELATKTTSRTVISPVRIGVCG